MAGRIRIGTSGWQYDGWRGDFYPPELPARSRLEYVAQQLDSVELNGSFYSLQRPTSYHAWDVQTPPDFCFAVKGSRYITHLKRLRDVDTGLANFFASGVLLLGRKLGPFLWQLPERVAFDPALITDFLDLLPRTTEEVAEIAGKHDNKVRGRVHLGVEWSGPVRHAFEVRHHSFVDDAFFGLLAERGMALVAADSPGKWPEVDVRTADFSYARLHGHTELYASGYAGKSLDRWAERCSEWAQHGDVYCYFDNDIHGHAPHDALALAERVCAVT